MHLSCIILDLMHMGDLGVVQMVLGNVLLELFFRMGGQVTRPEATIARMKAFMKEATDDLGCVQVSLSKLKLNAFYNKSKVCLKLKVVASRHLMPVVLRLLELHFPVRDDYDQRVYHCLRELCLMYDVLDNWTPASQAAAATHYRRHFLLYESLARDRFVPGHPWLWWRLKPKHHPMFHVLEQLGNPRAYWNYGGVVCGCYDC